MLTQIARFHRLISPKCRNLRTRRAWSSSYSSGPWTEEDEKDLQKWGSRSMTPVSLTNLMETGRGDNVEMFNRYLAAKQCKETVEQSEAIMMQIACFLHREVPLRIAQRALELQATDEFRSAPHVQKVANMYKDSFRFLRTLEEPTSMDKEAVFASKVGAIYEKHASTLISMARGAHEMRSALLIKQNLQNHTPDNEKLNLFSAENDDIQKRLNEFYFGRIGVRMLIGQYLALREDIIEDSKKEIDENSDVLPRKHIGLINCYTSPYEVAQRAIANASYICQRVHGDAPEVIILGVTNLTFPYIESHLEYILVELLKNSMRATIEKYGIDHMPPIKIVIADGHGKE